MRKHQTQRPLNRPFAIILVTALVTLATGLLAGETTNDFALCARAMVDLGDTARLQQVLAKASRGEKVTVAVIGGSITQGAAASQPEKRYGNLVAAWWREQFPKAKIDFVNAGIGATGSDYGALRASRDLLSHEPDFVVVEYAVNDPNALSAAETLEGLVRQILASPKQPAVALLFMMNQQGANAQEWLAKVGRHYRLPMVSYRDALWPEITAGRMQWSDISPDAVHPNDRGHAYASRFVISILEKALAALPKGNEQSAIGSIPAPIFTDLYQHTALFEAEALQPVSNAGWSYDPNARCWKSSRPGSVVEFELEGRDVFTMHWVIRGPMGRAKVTIDEGRSGPLEGWFDQTWGGYRQTREVARELAPGKHRIRFELLAEKSSQSTGHEFRILGLGAAGLTPTPPLAWPGEQIDTWHGFKRHKFTLAGCAAWVVEPKAPRPGNPWSWCMEFPDAFTDRCAAPALLAQGFHHAHIAVGNTFGSPAALKQFDAFYQSLTAQGLAGKVALIGLSRGGLYAYRWAAEHPARVAVIYGDAPVCDFKSWPGGRGQGKGSPGDWTALLSCYGFKDEAEALAYRGNPVDTLEPLAKARVALIHVVGDADDVVPAAENTALMEARYRQLGGEIQVIHKPDIGHHPHGLEDPSPVVNFILAHTAGGPGGSAAVK